MNIRISRLSMTNFKCFREKELNLDEDIITIRGRNGAGKTTIADAILFCLFGKNSEGQSDLELFKTREDGKVIPNLDHSVELSLFINEIKEVGEGGAASYIKKVTLKRSIKEVWIKKRGSEESVFKNNTVEYFVNGESYNKADYEKYITSLVDERVFRAITNPNYFPSLKWQDQRKFLTVMVGDIVPEEVANTEELAKLVMSLDDTNVDVESYLKHLKYQIKQIKDKLDKIPVRLEEQNKALPERLDWKKLQVERDDVSQQLKDLEEKITSIKIGDGADLKRKQAHKMIDDLSRTKKDIEDKLSQKVLEAKKTKNDIVSNLSLKFNEHVTNQRLMEQTIEADKKMIERCKQSIKECDEELERLRLAWPNRKFEFDSKLMEICPTCGQPLPPDLLNERKSRLRDNFNKELEADKQSLRDKAAKVKQTKADSEAELKSCEDKLASHTESLTHMKEVINNIFADKAKEEKAPIPVLDELLAADIEYQEAAKKIDEYEEKLNSITDSDDNREQLAALEQQKSTYTERFSLITQQLAMKMPYERGISLIEGIKAEQGELVKQLSELEKKEDVARQYQFRQNQLLEERINKHFSLVQWKLFRTVNNGGDSFEEPFCECYVNGIPYHAGLNQAARLNAGLDIINALCKFYNVAAPICLDNSESCINIMQTAGQQVRLQVTDTDLQLV